MDLFLSKGWFTFPSDPRVLDPFPEPIGLGKGTLLTKTQAASLTLRQGAEVCQRDLCGDPFGNDEGIGSSVLADRPKRILGMECAAVIPAVSFCQFLSESLLGQRAGDSEVVAFQVRSCSGPMVLKAKCRHLVC